MAIRVEDASLVQAVPLRTVTLGWFLKRSLIGVAILMVAMGGLAWLTYASIDPDADIDGTPKAAKAMRDAAPRVTAIDL